MDKEYDRIFIQALEIELIPAMGCTEPIALAYAGAKAAQVLEGEVRRITVQASGNMIKNVRSVTIPHSHGMTGIEAAVSLGCAVCDPSLGMEVLSKAGDAEIAKAEILAKNTVVKFLDSPHPLHFIIELYGDTDTVMLEVRDSHTNIVNITKNGEVIFFRDDSALENEEESGFFTLSNIREFADTVDLDLVRPLIQRQIECNMAIAEEGMSGAWGLGIGQTIRRLTQGSDFGLARAYAAAGSEARMAGCELPVIICSGSGNQGITCSVPVIVMAGQRGISEEKLYRSLVFSSLLTIYQKSFIGKLSAFCGAVSASIAAGAAITYMLGGTDQQISDTITNAMADIPGIICDGAKISCAFKISTGLESVFLGQDLAMHGKAYNEYNGILKDCADRTISAVGSIGKEGMRETDKVIIQRMLEN